MFSSSSEEIGMRVLCANAANFLKCSMSSHKQNQTLIQPNEVAMHRTVSGRVGLIFSVCCDSVLITHFLMGAEPF